MSAYHRSLHTKQTLPPSHTVSTPGEGAELGGGPGSVRNTTPQLRPLCFTSLSTSSNTCSLRSYDVVLGQEYTTVT